MNLQHIRPKHGTTEISSTTIIKEDLKRHQYTGDIEEHLKRISACLEEKRGVLVRFSNTLFFGVTVEPQVFSVHLYTIDPVRELMGAINAAIETVKYAGVKRLCATTKTQQIIKLLQRMGYPVEVKQDGDTFSWSMEINSEI